MRSEEDIKEIIEYFRERENDARNVAESIEEAFAMGRMDYTKEDLKEQQEKMQGFHINRALLEWILGEPLALADTILSIKKLRSKT